MGPKKEIKSKEEKAKSAAGSSKGKKKKWSKGKTREKLNNACWLDAATYEKLLKEVPSYKLITPSVISERLKLNGSVSRRCCAELVSKGLIKVIATHNSQLIYTRATKEEAVTAAVVEKKEGGGGVKKVKGAKKAAAEADAAPADE